MVVANQFAINCKLTKKIYLSRVENMEMRTIKQISNELNVSTQAIYHKINKSMKFELKKHIVKENGQTFIDEDGFNLLKDKIQPQQIVVEQEKIENELELIEEDDEQFAIDVNQVANGENKLLFDQILSLHNEIKFLKKEIDTKNKLIDTMSGEIQKEQEYKRSQSDKIIGLADQLAELVRNNQVLLREAQEKTSILVQEQFDENENSKKKKGFFKKRFNKSK